MMRSFTLAILFITVSVFSFGQAKPARTHFKNDLQRQKIKGHVRTVTENEYNDRGDSLKVKSVSRFNDKGNLAEFYTYSPSGAVLSRTTFKYNDSDKLEEEIRYKADGILNVRTTCRYDEKGNKIEEYNYDISGTLFMSVKGKFDGKGNRLVKDSYNEFGALFLKCNSKFDDDGNEISSKEYDSHKGLKFTTTYDYEGVDKSGNWLKRTTNKNDDPASVTVREIEYY
jgi:hypothetical protein